MIASDSGKHGFKQITVANWAEMDDIIQFPEPVRDETWVRACLSFQLNSNVPNEIAALFEVARSSMIYGWFFYPLITLASEQLHRILETAARARCGQLGLPLTKPGKGSKPRVLNFSEIIQSLTKVGSISSADLGRWEATRKLRNWASHPAQQTIISPGMALNGVESSCAMLNHLFK